MPPIPKRLTANVQLRLSAAMHEQVKALAARRDRSVSEELRAAVVAHLEAAPSSDQP